MYISHLIKLICIRIIYFGFGDSINEVMEVQITERLEVSVAYITAKGIKFNDLYYTNGKMIQLGWFERALKKGEWKVPIIYDPIDVSEIYILHLYQVINASAISLSDYKINSDIQKLYFEAVQLLKTRLKGDSKE
ncbi:Mu transposase, C-terminal [Paenibacillus typhae]|uniref:Mu transposase, C-terminal n=1 Tax=Paenibacillus typhae TaxID=1174501 RepID=A0A1G8GNY8_9BACL|nr:Mu transposase, C-terminal [Paenibacillus typhae]